MPLGPSPPQAHAKHQERQQQAHTRRTDLLFTTKCEESVLGASVEAGVDAKQAAPGAEKAMVGLVWSAHLMMAWGDHLMRHRFDLYERE